MTPLEYSEQAPTIEELNALSGYVLLEFGTPWCGHCQAAEAAITAVVNKQKLHHIKVYDGKGKKLGRLFKVKLWPTVILLNKGEELARVVRPVSEHEVLDLCNRMSGS